MKLSLIDGSRRRRQGCRLVWAVLAVLALSVTARAAESAVADDADQVLCAIIETSARSEGLPVDFFTKLIWRESSFRLNAISPAGAQGVAQFMPGTAAERGLENPFDPQAAIPESAKLIAELSRQFGNLGLAAAAYNAGPTATADWLAGLRAAPLETEDYVLAITNHALDEWRQATPPKLAAPKPDETCVTLVVKLRASAPAMAQGSRLFAPWGVQIAGNFSKARALSAFARVQRRYASVIADSEPFVLASRLRYRGWRTFYRVRLPAPTRAAAVEICGKLHALGDACIVLSR